MAMITVLKLHHLFFKTPNLMLIKICKVELLAPLHRCKSEAKKSEVTCPKLHSS